MVATFGQIPWGGSPQASTNDRYYPIIRANHKGPLYAQIISRHLLSCPTHWIDRSTEPCMGNRELCLGCRDGLPARVKVYVLALGRATGKLGILELSPESIRNCPRLDGDGKVIRGVWVKVYRRAAYSNAPIVVEVQAETAESEVKVVDEDIRPHLGRIWGMLPTKGMHKGNARKARQRGAGGAA